VCTLCATAPAAMESSPELDEFSEIANLAGSGSADWRLRPSERSWGSAGFSVMQSGRAATNPSPYMARGNQPILRLVVSVLRRIQQVPLLHPARTAVWCPDMLPDLTAAAY
jgi:hypothetical protein